MEIWHCDAGGSYSGAESQSAGGPGGGPPGSGGTGDLVPTDDHRYLRGAQVTDAEGIVAFTTIWPGWYRGRTVHVHAMVHVGQDRTLTTQVMFDEAVNDVVMAAEPYAGRGERDTRNENDFDLPARHGRRRPPRPPTATRARSPSTSTPTGTGASPLPASLRSSAGTQRDGRNADGTSGGTGDGLARAARTAGQILILIALTAVVLWLIYQVRTVAISLVLAIFITVLMMPPARSAAAGSASTAPCPPWAPSSA